MGYHDAVGRERQMVADACRFLNDRARLEIGFRRTLKKIGASEADVDLIIKDVRAASFELLDIFLEDMK